MGSRYDSPLSHKEIALQDLGSNYSHFTNPFLQLSWHLPYRLSLWTIFLGHSLELAHLTLIIVTILVHIFVTIVIYFFVTILVHMIIVTILFDIIDTIIVRII